MKTKFTTAAYGDAPCRFLPLPGTDPIVARVPRCVHYNCRFKDGFQIYTEQTFHVDI